MLVLLVFLLALPAAAQTSTGTFLRQADAAYALRNDPAQAKVALDIYEQAINTPGVNAEIYWKASRTAWWIGEHAAARKEKLEDFKKGAALAKEALARNPDQIEAHFWLAANDGSYGEAKGVLKSLSMVKPIRREMAEVIRLNDHFLGGGGYRVLGVVDYKVPGIAGGNKKRALEELNKAKAIDPRDPFTHYYLAEYFKVTGDKPRARAELEALQHLTAPPETQPELWMMQKKGEALSKDLQ